MERRGDLDRNRSPVTQTECGTLFPANGYRTRYPAYKWCEKNRSLCGQQYSSAFVCVLGFHNTICFAQRQSRSTPPPTPVTSATRQRPLGTAAPKPHGCSHIRKARSATTPCTNAASDGVGGGGTLGPLQVEGARGGGVKINTEQVLRGKMYDTLWIWNGSVPHACRKD